MAKKPSELAIALENAKAAKARAQAAREQAEAEEAEAEEFMRLYEKFAPKDEVAAAKAAEPAMSVIDALNSFAPPPMSSTAEIQEAARAYLREVGRPVSIREIYETITYRGVRIGGHKPMMNLSAKLSTSGDMAYSRDTGWWFKAPPEPNIEGLY